MTARLLIFILWTLFLPHPAAAAEKYPLTVQATPPDSRIRIMNIRPKYQPGIHLSPGRYDIKVVRTDYTAKRQWVKIVNKAVIVQITLAKSGNKSAAAVLKDSNWLVRGAAAKMLGEIGDKHAVELLITVLKDRDQYVRLTATEALGKIGDKHAVVSLIVVLKDKDQYVRWAAAEALGKIGDKKAVESLIAALKDNDKDMRWATAKAGQGAFARRAQRTARPKTARNRMHAHNSMARTRQHSQNAAVTFGFPFRH
ncbi:MAG: HEAT repeat domain-containing protein [Gammaproteobacteria bacterium]|nr:HEAT repeat domain-containing protein [Gammaproteobacteria bacterium]